jgi:DNA-binding Xre family transcriptional regulator
MKKLTPVLRNHAIDIYAHQPNVKHSDVAEQLGISPKTLMKLRRDPNFWNKIYSEFCIHMEGELPDIVRAMSREALAGNVQAGKLMLEWAGKLEKTFNVNISSPWEVWLEHEKLKGLQITNDEYTDIQDGEIIGDMLPERTADNSRQAVEEGFAKLDKEMIKKKKWYARRKELYSWSKRAEIVGIAPLPPRRPTKGQRLAWEESIVKAEGL